MKTISGNDAVEIAPVGRLPPFLNLLMISNMLLLHRVVQLQKYAVDIRLSQQ